MFYFFSILLIVGLVVYSELINPIPKNAPSLEEREKLAIRRNRQVKIILATISLVVIGCVIYAIYNMQSIVASLKNT